MTHECKYEHRWEALMEKVDAIYRALYGNGRQGILLEIDRNAQHRKFMQRWGWLIISLITSIPFTVFTGVIIWFFNFRTS